MGAFFGYLLFFCHTDAFRQVSAKQWRYSRRFQLQRSPAGQLTHDRRLFDLLLHARRCYKPKRMGVGLLIQYDAHPDTCLSPQRWKQRLGQRMHQPRCQSDNHGKRHQLFRLLL